MPSFISRLLDRLLQPKLKVGDYLVFKPDGSVCRVIELVGSDTWRGEMVTLSPGQTFAAPLDRYWWKDWERLSPTHGFIPFKLEYPFCAGCGVFLHAFYYCKGSAEPPKPGPVYCSKCV